ncbi:uncharacterized protein DUF397 [Actinoallomurus bryophytorum]|uniref:Uncharacterized protein DUF397 n=1 Tax=Actinoallomurus bryophytorum TaxID=1490222 RepID=A0A543C180_9ACTN|nr:uncharacterized protein DUF397 [Actinoallomurus bryophytorum]
MSQIELSNWRKSSRSQGGDGNCIEVTVLHEMQSV